MKKLLSLLLSIVVICSCFSCLTMTSVSALDSRIESALQWAVNIANDNSHGYSWDGRWGPDYDCSSLVISAFKNAGFNVGSATYTGNMRKEFEEAGFTWIPKSQIYLSNSSQLQRGDILLDESAHTEIYLGNGQNIGAHRGYKSQWCSHSNNDGKYHRHGHYNLGEQKGDQDGGEISVAGYYNYPWDGVLRYQSQEPVNNPVLAKNFEGIECSNGMEITFTWNEINNMTGYNLYVAKNIDGTVNYDWSNARIYLPGTNSTQYTFSKGTLSVGNYAAYVQAVNIDTGEKSEQSNCIYFSIFDDESLKSQISLAKSFNGNTCSSAENITFSWSTVSGMTGYNLYVAKNIEGTVNYDWSNARIYLPGDTTSLYTMTKGTKSKGNYAAYIQAVNLSTGYTSRQSNFIYFNIVDDIWFDINTQPEAIYYIGKTDSFKVRGWAVNTGKQEVSCYLSIDDGQEILLDKQQRTDVSASSLYSDFCPSEFVGFIGEVDLSKYDIGKHTIKVVAKSLTAEKIIFDSNFEIVGINFGDTDGDGTVSIMDVTEIQRHIAQLSTIPDDKLTCADTDKDGIITINDATQIQRFIAQLIPNL